MSAATLWWIVATVLTGASAERARCTCWCLATGASCRGRGGAHAWDWAPSTQMVLAAIVGIVNVAWHVTALSLSKHPIPPTSRTTPPKTGSTSAAWWWCQLCWTTAAPYEVIGALHGGGRAVCGPFGAAPAQTAMVVDIRRNQLVLRPEQ